MTKTATKTEPELEPLDRLVGTFHWKDDLRITYRRRA
jgi:hypothetical protein